MPNGPLTSLWSVTAFSPVFGDEQNEGDPDATAARAKNDLIRENLPQGIISNLL